MSILWRPGFPKEGPWYVIWESSEDNENWNKKYHHDNHDIFLQIKFEGGYIYIFFLEYCVPLFLVWIYVGMNSNLGHRAIHILVMFPCHWKFIHVGPQICVSQRTLSTALPTLSLTSRDHCVSQQSVVAISRKLSSRWCGGWWWCGCCRRDCWFGL
jgi:hypothetical protein